MIIPADIYPVVEKISRKRFSISVHIQFYEDDQRVLLVREEIVLLFADSLTGVRKVAEICNCNFESWAEWTGNGFALIDVEEAAD